MDLMREMIANPMKQWYNQIKNNREIKAIKILIM